MRRAPLEPSPRSTRGPQGAAGEGSGPTQPGKTTPLIAARSLEGMQAPLAIEGGVDGRTFETSVREVLAPQLEPGQIVILDTLGAHQDDSIRHLVEACGCPRRSLPSSSPDLTPIEEAFSKITTGLRRAAARGREALIDAIGEAGASVTSDDALGWFQQAGYRPFAQSP